MDDLNRNNSQLELYETSSNYEGWDPSSIFGNVNHHELETLVEYSENMSGKQMSSYTMKLTYPSDHEKDDGINGWYDKANLILSKGNVLANESIPHKEETNISTKDIDDDIRVDDSLDLNVNDNGYVDNTDERLIEEKNDSNQFLNDSLSLYQCTDKHHHQVADIVTSEKNDFMRDSLTTSLDRDASVLEGAPIANDHFNTQLSVIDHETNDYLQDSLMRSTNKTTVVSTAHKLLSFHNAAIIIQRVIRGCNGRRQSAKLQLLKERNKLKSKQNKQKQVHDSFYYDSHIKYTWNENDTEQERAHCKRAGDADVGPPTIEATGFHSTRYVINTFPDRKGYDASVISGHKQTYQSEESDDSGVDNDSLGGLRKYDEDMDDNNSLESGAGIEMTDEIMEDSLTSRDLCDNLNNYLNGTVLETDSLTYTKDSNALSTNHAYHDEDVIPSVKDLMLLCHDDTKENSEPTTKKSPSLNGSLVKINSKQVQNREIESLRKADMTVDEDRTGSGRDSKPVAFKNLNVISTTIQNQKNIKRHVSLNQKSNMKSDEKRSFDSNIRHDSSVITEKTSSEAVEGYSKLHSKPPPIDSDTRLPAANDRPASNPIASRLKQPSKKSRPQIVTTDQIPAKAKPPSEMKMSITSIEEMQILKELEDLQQRHQRVQAAHDHITTYPTNESNTDCNQIKEKVSNAIHNERDDRSDISLPKLNEQKTENRIPDLILLKPEHLAINRVGRERAMSRERNRGRRIHDGVVHEQQNSGKSNHADNDDDNTKSSAITSEKNIIIPRRLKKSVVDDPKMAEIKKEKLAFGPGARDVKIPKQSKSRKDSNKNDKLEENRPKDDQISLEANDSANYHSVQSSKLTQENDFDLNSVSDEEIVQLDIMQKEIIETKEVVQYRNISFQNNGYLSEYRKRNHNNRKISNKNDNKRNFSVNEMTHDDISTITADVTIWSDLKYKARNKDHHNNYYESCSLPPLCQNTGRKDSNSAPSRLASVEKNCEKKDNEIKLPILVRQSQECDDVDVKKNMNSKNMKKRRDSFKM